MLDADHAINAAKVDEQHAAEAKTERQNQLLNQILESVRSMEDREHMKSREGKGAISFDSLPDEEATVDGSSAQMLGTLNGGVNHMNRTFERLIGMHTDFNHNQKALAVALHQQ